jgi:RHS repeat-associated protein
MLNGIGKAGIFSTRIKTLWGLVGTCVLMLLTSQGQAAVGRTEGSASVSTLGAAQYEIPLRMLPGTHGLQPSLSLQYRSDRENGIVGMGFAVTGFSAITRCDKSFAQDGAPAAVARVVSDALCLDEQRLRLVSGTQGMAGSVYRTEVETYAKITALGSAGEGPASFEVRRGDGLIYEYGQNSSARIEYPGEATVRAWALSAVRDRAGNRMDFTYLEDGASGGYRPNNISYNGNPAAGVGASTSINFIYESSDRPDPVYLFNEGKPAHQFKRLMRIELQQQGSLVRQYLLTYTAAMGASGRSRLGSVQECASTTSDCLSATQLTWTNSVASLQPEQNPMQSIPGGGLATLHLIDVSGDGRDDLVYVSSEVSGAGTWRVRRATASGGYEAEINTGISNTNYSQALSLQWDGDGRIDLLVPLANNRYHVLRANGTGFDTPIDTQVPVTSGGDYVRAFDLNGDGLEDLVRLSASGAATVFVRYRNATGYAAETQVWSSLSANFRFSNGFATRPHYFKYRSPHRKADFNGDQKEDFIAYLQDFDPESNKSVFYFGVFFNGVYVGQFDFVDDNGGNHLWADLNGDDATDILWVSTTKQVRAAISADGNFLSGGVIFGPQSASFNGGFATVLDYDGDGLDDVILPNGSPSGSNLHFVRSTGVGLVAPVATDLSWAGQSLRAADIDANGFTDLAFINTALTYRRHVAVPADLLDRATDGYGNYSDFDYLRIAESASTYIPGSGAVFPTVEFTGPMTVVATQTSSNGIGGTFTLTYQYEQAREHLQGRGFLGFAKRTVTDSRNGLRVEESYLQDPAEYQTIGAPATIRVKQPSGTLIREQVNTWSKLTFGSGTSERRYPYVSTQVNREYEVGGTYNGQLLVTSTTTSSVDTTSGVPVDVTTTRVEGNNANGLAPGQSHSARTYLPSVFNDETNWCLGRPNTTQQINSHTQFGGAAQTRTVTATWDGLYCRPTQSVIEPGHPTLQVTTGLAYDSFGNLATQTVTPVGETNRVTQLNWGSDGRFPRTLTNPLSQVTTLDWWTGLGVLKSRTDPNGLITSFNYDGVGRLTLQTQPDGTSSLTEYLACDADCSGFSNMRFKVRSTQRDTSAGTIAQSFIVFDDLERARRASQYALEGGLINQLTEYDALGRVSRTSVPYFALVGAPVWTRFTYDVLGREREASRERTNEVDASAATSTVQYEGLSVTGTDPLGKMRIEIINPLGQVSRVTQAAGTVDQSLTGYDYDAFGSLVRTTDNAGNQTTIGYNVRGFKTSLADPDLGSSTYDYYALGELKSQTDAKSQTTSFTYDTLSRPLTRIEPADSGSGTQTTTFTWGTSAASFNLGQLQSIAVGSYSETYSYDNRARLSSTTVVADGGTYVLSQSYKAATGQLDTITYPTSTGASPFKVQYEYDTANKSGLLKQVKDFNAGTVFWQAISSNALDQYPDVTLGNGLKTLTAFDSITGAINRIETGPSGGNTRQHLQYVWDKLGNLGSRQDVNIAKTETFTYDHLYRMIQAQVSGNPALTVAYNAIGNITSKSDLGSYSYHPTKKHAVTTAGPITTSYDANGNIETQTSPSGTATLSWTAYNLPKLISVSTGRSSAFLYGPDRQRYKHVAVTSGVTETTIYVKGIFEKVTRPFGTEYRHFIQGPEGVLAIHNRKSSGTNETRYLLKDHLGSTDVITDEAGASQVKLSFGAFGKRRNGATWSGSPTSSDQIAIASTSRLAFTGHEQLDHLDLVHMNGRVYQPLLGRFISADPFVQDPFNSQSLNRYSYVFNNPLTFTDPSGFCASTADGCGGGFFSTIGFGFGSSYNPASKFSHPNKRAPAPAGGIAATQTGGGDGFGSSVGSVGGRGGIGDYFALVLISNVEATSNFIIGTGTDFTPIVGDIKAIKETADDPTAVNIIATGVSFVPAIGDVGRAGIKRAAVGLDANALIDAIENQGAALAALGKRIPIVSIRAAREFARGSYAQFSELGAAATRRLNLQKLREFLSVRGGRIGRAGTKGQSDRFFYSNGIKLGDAEVLGSAENEGIKVLTRDGKLIKNFPELTERF